tara:strand:+ start:14238 stop:14969 length:732 start_codon:yes stop_codon:yes gene_type:complete
MPKPALLALFLASLTLLSCGLRESIVPLAAPEPLAGTELEIVVPISSIDVPNITDQVNSVSLIGPIFGNIAASLADMTLHEDDGKEIPVDPMIFEFPVLEGADLSAIRELKVKAIKLHAVANNEEISLHFFRKIEIYLQAKPEVLGHENVTSEEANAFVETQDESADKAVKGQLILSYDRDLHTLRCLTRCMDLQVSDTSWKSILQTGRRFVLRTRVVVDSIPASDMKIGGRVVVRGKIDPGF